MWIVPATNRHIVPRPTSTVAQFRGENTLPVSALELIAITFCASSFNKPDKNSV